MELGMTVMTFPRRALFMLPLIGALCLALNSTPVFAQQADRATTNRLDRLERLVDTLQKQVGKGGSVSPNQDSMPADVAGRLQYRITQIETLVTQLTGQLEQTNFQNTQLKSQLERLQKDVEFRLGELEKRASQPQAMAPMSDGGEPVVVDGGETGGADPALMDPEGQPTSKTADKAASAEDDKSGALPKGTPDEQYQHTRKLLQQGNYPAAEKALSAFLKANPKHPLAGNAMYWLGETYYVRGQFAQAAETFLKGFQNYPKNSKTGDNLLKLGLSLIKEGSTEDGCKALSMVAKESSSMEAIKRRAESEKKSAGCK